MKNTVLFVTTLFIHSLSTLFAFAQEDFASQLLEGMESFQEEDGSQFEVENLIDLLNELKESKLDLNSAAEEDFDQLPFLNDRDAYNLVLHRQLYGNYQTLYELRNIPGMEMEKIKRLLPFVVIRQEKKVISFKERLQQGQSQIYLDADRYLQGKKGYEKDSAGMAKYAGSPLHYYSKHLFHADRIKLSLVGEKDAGEAEWSPNNRIFDFFSASLSLEGNRWVKHLCIGDYTANFGQGLVVGKGSILGKNASITNSYKSTQGIKRYASTGESGFFRGVGATLGWHDLSLTLFGSIRKGDATLTGDEISSFKTDGMHRTPLEIGKKRNYTEHVAGVNLHYKKGRFAWGYTALFYHFSRELATSTKRYTHYRLGGTDHHWNMGVDYKWRARHTTLFGECAIDANGHFATMNGATILPLSRLEVTLAQRSYHYAYQSLYGKGFSENSRIENEQGIYLCTRFSPIKRVTIAAYMDCYRFPWALYASPMPSSGEEYCLQTFVRISKRADETIKYKFKEKNGEAKQTLRSTFNLQTKGWRWQSIIEANRATSQEGHTSYGWIVSQSATGEIRQIHLSLRYAFFQAKDYINRIYLYEKDLPYTLSFPMHYGQGHRVAISLMWKKSERLQLHAKAGWFIYTDGRESIGTGNEMMQGNVSTQVKAMLKVTI